MRLAFVGWHLRRRSVRMHRDRADPADRSSAL